MVKVKGGKRGGKRRGSRAIAVMVILAALASGTALAILLGAKGGGVGAVKALMYMGEGCACCRAYARYLEDLGLNVETRVVPVEKLVNVKRGLGVPERLWACHTLIIQDYVVEGHVPWEAVARLLAEKPGDIDGIAVPGMPPGSPGMPGPRQGPIVVYWFREDGSTGVYHVIE